MSGYIEAKIRLAAQFLDDLRRVLLGDRAPEISARFVFRGQGDSSWGLVPSAFRSGTILGYTNREYARTAAERPMPTWDQGNAELVALMEFLKLADEVGLDVPADHYWLRLWNPFNNVVGHNIGIQEWPPAELYEALAVAQHHGVPTRLLDFTYDPLIAAYFAAKNPPTGADEIAVWSVDLQLIELAAKDRHCALEIVNVPRVRNRNLTAQKALFLLDRDVSLGQYAPLEDSIAAHVRSEPVDSAAVRKFCLPTSECGTLLDLLRRNGIDRAHLMPSFDGVVQELKARRSRGLAKVPVVGSAH